MELIDCHSHSAYSGHGSGTVEDMVRAAQTRGVSVYAQTEHLTLPESLDPGREDSMSSEDALRYQLEVATEQTRLRAEGCPMELVCGVEADWLPNRTAELEELCKPYSYVIGSIHFLDGKPLDNSDNMELWDELGADGVWERYLKHWEALVRSGAPITTLGHPDLPKVFGMLPSFDLREPFGDLASLVASKGLMIEVNTAGLRKDVAEVYPAPGILKLFSDAGVACCVGADAHKPADVAADIEKAYACMHDAGYRCMTVPTAQGDRRPIEL